MSKNEADLESLLRISYYYDTINFLTAVGYSKEKAEQLLKLYSQRKEQR